MTRWDDYWRFVGDGVVVTLLIPVYYTARFVFAAFVSPLALVGWAAQKLKMVPWRMLP